MKKIFTFFVIAMLVNNMVSFGQVLITQIYEGSSGNNKFIELTNLGSTSVDLSNPQLTLKLFSNKVDVSASPTKTYNLVGTITAGQSIIVRHTLATTPSYAISYTPYDSTNTVTSFNGAGTGSPIANTDIITLYNGATLVDVFAWGTFQYNDKSYYRNASITSPNATWTAGEWTMAPSLTDVDNAATNTLPRLGYHATSTVPYLNISSPASGATFYTTSINIVFSVGNFSIPSSGHIHYTVDGGAATMIYDTNPISLIGLSVGSHTVSMKLVDPSHADLNPAVTATTTFTIAAPTDVANLAALRASNADGTTVYRVTGEILLTFSNTYRNQKFFQDATGGILIDDASAIITTTYNTGDGITNLTGSISVYNNMLQFVPTFDPGTPSSVSNTITPVSLTLTEMNTDFEIHEAQLVKITSVTFKDANGSTLFANGKGYAITNSVDSFYTNFYSVNYIGLVVPSTSVNIVGLLHSRSTGNYISARNLADIEGLNNVEVSGSSDEVSVFPNPAKESVTIKNLDEITKIEVSNILGQVINTYSNLPKDEITLKLNGFNKGIYFITLYENDRVAKTMKFTKD